MSIAIQPKSSPAMNVKTQMPYVAVAFVVTGTLAPSGLVIRGTPTFLDTSGNPLPVGVLPLVPPIDQSAESELIAAAINGCPALA
jgi:hypothetical protein